MTREQDAAMLIFHQRMRAKRHRRKHRAQKKVQAQFAFRRRARGSAHPRNQFVTMLTHPFIHDLVPVAGAPGMPH